MGIAPWGEYVRYVFAHFYWSLRSLISSWKKNHGFVLWSAECSGPTRTRAQSHHLNLALFRHKSNGLPVYLCLLTSHPITLPSGGPAKSPPPHPIGYLSLLCSDDVFSTGALVAKCQGLPLPDCRVYFLLPYPLWHTPVFKVQLWWHICSTWQCGFSAPRQAKRSLYTHHAVQAHQCLHTHAFMIT